MVGDGGREDHGPILLEDRRGCERPHPPGAGSATRRAPGAGPGSALSLSDSEPLELVREWGVRRLGQELEVRTRAGLVKPVLVDLFPAYDEDGGVLVALSAR